MAKLTIQAVDAGKIIPLSGDLFWDVAGTAKVEVIDIAAGTGGKLTLGGGVDVVRFGGSPSEYTVHLDGVSAVFTHTSGATVSIPMTTLGDQVLFEGGDPLDLKIDTSSGAPKFLLGDQELTTNPEPVPGSVLLFELDGKGTTSVPFQIDASEDAFNFTDSASQFNNVRIFGFGDDDSIRISEATADQYDTVISSTSEGHVMIGYNNAGILNSIELVGAALNPDGTVGIVYDVATFNALPVGDLFFV